MATELQTEEAVASARRPGLRVGVIATPRLARDIDARLIEELEADLRRRYDTVDWAVELRFDRLVSPPATGASLVDAARRAMLDEGWDLALVVTDIPLRHDRRAVSTRASRTHRVAVVSLPALGTIHVRRRLRQTLLELVGALAAEEHEARDAGMDRRLRQLSGRTGARRKALGVASTTSLIAGHARLLVGMIRANRPWRLAARLYGALVPALAAGAYGVVTPEIWGISATLSWLRLLATALASIVVTIVALIVVHELWERAPDHRVRDQVVLFNVATAATITIGILTLYVALFVLILPGEAGTPECEPEDVADSARAQLRARRAARSVRCAVRGDRQACGEGGRSPGGGRQGEADLHAVLEHDGGAHAGAPGRHELAAIELQPEHAHVLRVRPVGSHR